LLVAKAGVGSREFSCLGDTVIINDAFKSDVFGTISVDGDFKRIHRKILFTHIDHFLGLFFTGCYITVTEQQHATHHDNDDAKGYKETFLILFNELFGAAQRLVDLLQVVLLFGFV